MSFEETDTEESASSLSELSFFDDDLDRMHVESGSSDEEISNDEMSSNVWKEIESESDEEFMEDHGLVEEVTSAPEDHMVNPIDCYRHFITDEIIDLMVRETNRYAEQYLEVHEISRRSKYRQWKPTTHEEVLKFFGIIIEMELVQMPQLNHYWSSSQLYGLEIIRSAMPRERFKLLLKFWHFSNNNNRNSKQDRLFKLKPLSDLLKERFSSVYIPGSVISIDESMIPWRGRLSFRQYIPGKAHKYGIKMYKLAATNGYTWNYVIYTSEQESMAGVGHAQAIVMTLLDGLDGCYRTVVADNFFTSISFAKYLLEHDTYLIGTLRSNRVGSGTKVLADNLSRGEVYGLQSQDGIKLIRWKDKNDVLMISTRPSHSASVVDSGKTNFQNERIMKPQVVLDYNEGRQGTDLSDQLSAYYTCLRKSIKWYRKVAFELVFGTALVNSYLIYKENYTESKVTILQFRESLVQSLLLGMPMEKLKPGPRQKSASHSKRKLADHKLEEKEGSTRNVGRRCTGCYAKRRAQQSRETSRAAAKKVKSFCSDCEKFFCLECFNDKHYAME
jgi:hypothetical protein